MTAPRAVYVDRLTVPSVVALALRARGQAVLWTFDPPTQWGQRLARALHLVGALPGDLRLLRAHVGQIRDPSGASRLPGLIQEIRALCEEIRAAHIDNHPLLLALRGVWEPRLVATHFDKLIETEVRREVLRLALVDWLHPVDARGSGGPFIVVARSRWLAYLEPWARQRGLTIVTYLRPPDLAGWIDALARAGRVVVRLALSALRRGRQHSGPHRPDFPGGSHIAIRYGHTGLEFASTERSELFWMADTTLPPQALVLYDVTGDIDGGTIDELRRRGVRMYGRGQNLSSWRPTFHTVRIFVTTMRKVAAATLHSWRQGKPVGAFRLSQVVRLAADYARWVDFFTSHGTRVHVGTLHTPVAATLAMDTVGGAAVSYQYSASNLTFPTSMLTAGEHVQFVFSQAFAHLWQQVNPAALAVVATGFIYDRDIRSFRHLDRVAAVRRRLLDHGAQFVLCFFDENSADRWDIPAPHAEAAQDYEFLLRWALEDRSLGIIFKPKKYSDLFARIARVRPLIAQALETGRVEFLGDPTPARRIFPAEAAAASDLAIGKLGGTTAALEAYLAGCPALLVDSDAFRAHPIYTWGRGRVLFEDWPSVRAVVEQFRAAPEEHRSVGDWSPGIDTYDPYRDSQAGLRVGLFIQWLHESLLAGAQPERAVAHALTQFASRWPADGLRARQASGTVR